MYVESLANKVHLSQATVQAHLKRWVEVGFQIAKHGKWVAVTVPADDVLDRLLSGLGVDTSIFKPMSALVNGSYRNISCFRRYTACSDGRFRFDVDWSSFGLPATVCCHDLNSSARAHVRTVTL